MAETTIVVTGLREVQKKLYQYSQSLGDRVVLGSLRVGANLVKRQAQANAPVKSGLLKRKGIVIRKSKIHRGRSSTDMIGIYITIASKKKTDPYYGKFQEAGWNTKGKLNDARYSKKIRGFTRRAIGSSRITQRGKTNVPGKRFLYGAFDQTKEQAVEAVRQAAITASKVLERKVGL